ncbi:DUF4277 domain-containing protein [Candidatus Hakubella thermalkaliphila]|uniref:DUF4277 domain-containing protein n=1 Tax=Candidatus Hakubella thermalkaliphila TaxID=2754717 RepID=UPI002158B2D3|nr:DUF4277 domain-containing protein [Candidatus Hakubella thermalkaliphila]
MLTEREPIYRLAEVVNTFAPEGFGLSRQEAERLADDAIGRALDRLFDADRGSLLTEIVIAAGELLSLSFDELHNDSTTVKFTGHSTPGRRGGASEERGHPTSPTATRRTTETI